MAIEDHDILGSTGDRYLDQYFGAWAIDDMAANGLLAKAGSIHLSDHRAAFIREIDAKEVERISAIEGESSSNGPYHGQLTQDGVAIIPVRGTLMKFSSSLSSSSGTVALRREVRQAVADDRVRGIMLKVESPGGTVAGTAELADDVQAAAGKKPLWAFADDLMASAAYWVSAPAARIGANRTAMVGSLGTVAVLYDFSQNFEKQGIEANVFSTGKFKGTGAVGSKVTDDQKEYYQSLIDETNTHFKSAVEAGRGSSTGKLFDGRVHVAGTAKDLGLVDTVASFDEFYGEFVQSLRKGGSKVSAESEAVPVNAEQETGVEMANENKTDDKTPTSATASDIRSACPGATGDFVLAQIEQNATLEQSLKAYVKLQGETISARDATITEKDAAIVSANDEIKALKAKVDAGQASSVNKAVDQPAAGTEVKADATGTPSERAEAEWDASADLKSRFPQKKHYVGYRTAQIAGMVRMKR